MLRKKKHLSFFSKHWTKNLIITQEVSLVITQKLFQPACLHNYQVICLQKKNNLPMEKYTLIVKDGREKMVNESASTGIYMLNNNESP